MYLVAPSFIHHEIGHDLLGLQAGSKLRSVHHGIRTRKRSGLQNQMYKLLKGCRFKLKIPSPILTVVCAL